MDSLLSKEIVKIKPYLDLFRRGWWVYFSDGTSFYFGSSIDFQGFLQDLRAIKEYEKAVEEKEDATVVNT